ncbi:MAG: sulfotransferase [Fischerella sp. CENA71]|nr:sulfotransferase [Fischerella sp. CENA71]
MTVPPPLFILGSPRSFTSLICAMLGQHPEAYGMPELNLFITETLEQLLDRLKGVRQFQMHGLLRTVAQLYAGEQTILSVEMARRWVLTRLHQPTGEVYLELSRKVAPLRIVDKSPAYSTHLDILNRMRHYFPNAYYLHLVRHPRTQGKSIMNIADGLMAILANSIDYSTDPPTVDPQVSWYKMQCNILEFLSTIPVEQQMRLRGEDLLSDPRSHFEQLCKWLNLSWDDSIYEVMLQPENSPYACLGPYGAQLGNDPNFLKSPGYRASTIKPSHLEGALPWRPDNQGFTPEVIKMAQELGYE